MRRERTTKIIISKQFFAIRKARLLFTPKELINFASFCKEIIKQFFAFVKSPLEVTIEDYKGKGKTVHETVS
jgi:hypothetical protein